MLLIECLTVCFLFVEILIYPLSNTGKAVAIKIVSLATIDPWSAEGLKEAFLNEVSMSKRLAKTSRHIIEMFDFDFHPNGLTFIVMELGQQDLEKALKAKPLSSAERKVAWRQLVSIAMALHSHQIVGPFQSSAN